MKARFLLFLTLFCFSALILNSQSDSVNPTSIGQGTFLGMTKPLRDLPVMTKKDFRDMERYASKHELNEGLGHRSYPYAATALPRGEDALWQKFMGKTKSSSGPLVNFDGQTSPYFPPDCNGAVGPNHFMQTINCVYAIYDKSGVLVAGPTAMNQLFSGVSGSNYNDGDPVLLYDKEADRWLATEFSISGNPNYIMMAVSATNDPTGSWYKYSFVVASMPDYPKFSVWPDGYYMGDNNSAGNDIYVVERSKMLTGASSPQIVGFNNPSRPASVDGFMCVPPVTNDGILSPTGLPGIYIAFNDDALGGGSDQLWLYELHVNWTTPSASTFARTQQLDVEPFNASFGNNWNNIVQPGTSQRVDGIPQVIMNVPQYRNFGAYQTIVCCHTVNVDGVRHAGIRWYELRKTSGDWSIRQQGTYAPDEHSRWMGSIMLNGHNAIGLGYSVSSSSVYPGIRYCGQTPASYNSANGILDITEDTIWAGSHSQTGYNRWGDYSMLSVDPNDDNTFWFTTQYIGTGNARKTRIASFKFNTGPTVTTVAATNITGVSATLNGTVNPNGSPTFYRFAYGDNPLSLQDSTASMPAGSDTSIVNFNSELTNLLPNTRYFFRAIATSTAGPGSGSTLNFMTGNPPVMTVTPPNRDVSLSAGNTMFFVNSNTNWSVSSDVPWCTITPSGTGNDTIFAVYTANSVVGTRIAQITVTGTGVGAQTVTVTQQGIPVILLVTPPNRNVAQTTGTTSFYVTSNTSWSVLSLSSWCTVTNSGTGNDSIYVTFEPSSLYYPRVDTIIISATIGIAAQVVTVTQGGLVPILAVSPPNQNVSAPAGNTSFTVTSNLNWEVASDTSWCTVTTSGNGNGTIVANFTENTDQQPRVAHIRITSPQVPAGTLQQDVTVTQAKPNAGVGENDSRDVKIYPNPTKGVFRIVPPKGSNGNLDIKVENLEGKVILSKECRGEKEYVIDLSIAPEGSYNIIIRTQDNTIVRRLVIIK
ncbi:MAG: BACON domain-containing carbohydrate-binding protein [Bacteroidetes bacterium]|nr:BACON domain-containing carbohydrate-binding protein [Bacteroidota bacterium]